MLRRKQRVPTLEQVQDERTDLTFSTPTQGYTGVATLWENGSLEKEETTAELAEGECKSCHRRIVGANVTVMFAKQQNHRRKHGAARPIDKMENVAMEEWHDDGDVRIEKGATWKPVGEAQPEKEHGTERQARRGVQC